MSSLAMMAAQIETYENVNDNSTNTSGAIYRKRNTHNKTHRKLSNDFDEKKVNSVLSSIHNNTSSDDDDVDMYLPRDQHRRVEAKNDSNRHKDNRYENSNREGMHTLQPGGVPQPNGEQDMELQELKKNFMDESQTQDYYKKIAPRYQTSNEAQSQPTGIQDNTVIDKLNYMIHLMEEQQDMRTSNVTEEVILYSFLGVFIIFIVDGFARVGKYTR